MNENITNAPILMLHYGKYYKLIVFYNFWTHQNNEQMH